MQPGASGEDGGAGAVPLQGHKGPGQQLHSDKDSLYTYKFALCTVLVIEFWRKKLATYIYVAIRSKHLEEIIFTQSYCYIFFVPLTNMTYFSLGEVLIPLVHFSSQLYWRIADKFFFLSPGKSLNVSPRADLMVINS